MPLHDAYMCIGIATSNKKLLGAPGIATRSMPMRHRVDRLERSLASSCPELDVGNTSVCVCVALDVWLRTVCGMRKLWFFRCRCGG